MKLCWILISSVFATTLLACGGTPSLPLEEPSPEAAISGGQYEIAPGDILAITVFGHDDISGQYTVDAEGKISMPLINQIDVDGATTDELQRRLIAAYQPDYLRNPDISVKLESYRPIYVLGEVENAGSYPYQPKMSVLNAIALAGGYTYRAAKNKLYVVRDNDPNREEEPVTVSDTLRPGDTVIIRQRFF